MEAAPTPIINYFSGFRQNLVPLFQRPYSWERRNWQDLWDDILDLCALTQDRGAPHFMGAAVTVPVRAVPVGVSKFLVIGGQQRLTTLAVLLCAIRDTLASDSTKRRHIQFHYLTNDGYEGLDFFKLLPTQGDRPDYSALIKGTDGPDLTEFLTRQSAANR